MAYQSQNYVGCYSDDVLKGVTADTYGDNIGSCAQQALSVGKAFLMAKKHNSNSVACYFKPSSGDINKDVSSLTPTGTCSSSATNYLGGDNSVAAYVMLDTSVNSLNKSSPTSVPYVYQPGKIGTFVNVSDGDDENQYQYYKNQILYLSNRYAQVLALLQMNPDPDTTKTLLGIAAYLNQTLQNIITDLNDTASAIGPQCQKLQKSMQGEISKLQSEWYTVKDKNYSVTSLNEKIKQRNAQMKGYSYLVDILTGVLAIAGLGSLYFSL